MSKNIIAQVAGGKKEVLDDVRTVGDAATKVGASSGYTAAIDGDCAEFSRILEDGQMVTFAKAVKGGR